MDTLNQLINPAEIAAREASVSYLKKKTTIYFGGTDQSNWQKMRLHIT